jgi:uncharacterized membrane protein YkvA (DUF1232 family)
MALSIAGGVLLLWAVLLVLLAVAARRHGTTICLVDGLRLVPDVVRLVKRLAADPSVSRGVRVWLVVLLVYLLLPFDLVPDFIPVIGVADDAIVVALVLRFATRRAGPEAIDRHWPGTPQGLAALRTLIALG